MSTQERRRYPRSPAPPNLFIAWQTGTQQGVSRLSSIALGGLYIRTPHPPPAQSLLRVLVETASGDLRARVFVRRVVANEGMGVEFTAMTQEDRARLVQLLRRVAA
jgi:PilZ domain-containing protein